MDCHECVFAYYSKTKELMCGEDEKHPFKPSSSCSNFIPPFYPDLVYIEDETGKLKLVQLEA
jgi:hypothetical protein